MKYLIKVTEEMRDKIYKRTTEGASSAQIGKELKLSPTTIFRHRADMGL